MKVVIQRVKKSSVIINNEIYNRINNGLMILVGFTEGDNNLDIDYIVKKVVNLRIFDDENGIMNKSILDTNRSILSISQFTLYAETKEGNRPRYIRAMNGAKAKLLYDCFNKKLREKVSVETGVFGEDMEIGLVNMGPTTILLER